MLGCLNTTHFFFYIMNNSIFVFSVVLVVSMLIGMNYESLYNYGQWISLMNGITDLRFSDTHEAVNNLGHYSTLGHIAIIDENSIEVTFNNKNNYGIYSEGVKIWSIPTQFEFIKTVNVGDIFIVHCREHDQGLGAQLLELVDIDIQNNNMTFNHYNVGLSPSVECMYPEIIEHSFDIKWDRFKIFV